jgi:hypothetical protein
MVKTHPEGNAHAGGVMNTNRFDLNDTQHEPSDEQLAELMHAVSEEASRRAREARQMLMQRVREELAAAHRGRPTP